MICETCADALDDTSDVTIDDHVCDGDGCECRCTRKKRYALVPSESEKVCTKHAWSYSGAMPCTGPILCTMCGTTRKDR